MILINFKNKLDLPIPINVFIPHTLYNNIELTIFTFWNKNTAHMLSITNIQHIYKTKLLKEK